MTPEKEAQKRILDKPIHPGTIIQGPQWPEPVEIKLIEETGENYIRIVGATVRTRQHIDQIIPKKEFDKLTVAKPEAAFSEEPWKVFLALETIRYRFASMYDPLLAMNTSKVDPLPHQIEAVYGYVLRLPRIRFLIADDPGAGKTIMAGLIIKEMKIRNQARRILIVAPGHLKDYPLFLPRHVTTVPFNLKKDSPNEQRLYNELSRYVNDQYNIALTRDKRRNVAFALVILQRRLASSTYALLRSLERRKKRLEELLEEASERFSGEAQRVLNRTRGLSFDFEAVEDMSEEERWREEEIWETLSVAENREELEKEIQTIEGLIRQAREIIQREEEIKIRALKRSLRELEQKFRDPKDKKILIFTESRDTLDYLEKKIRSWGYTTNTIHGGMRLEDRIKAESIFQHETQVMVATEAAGEGINLQFCHMMINYDIPWNPNRLEQRMGRIHRYGQTKEVYIYNLVAEDTREGRVLHAVFRKIEEIRKALGSDKVFDVLGEVLYDKNLSQLLTEAAAFARSIDEIIAEIDVEVDEAYIARVKENLGESLATRFIDYTRIKEMAQQAREHRLIPEYTESKYNKHYIMLALLATIEIDNEPS